MTPTSRAALGPRGAAITVGVVLAVAGGLAACNFIVGVGSYSVGGGDSGTSDSSATEDTGMQAADSGQADVVKPTDSGAGSDAGDAQTEGGACGAGLQTTSAAFQQLLKTCVLAQSCDPYAFQVSLSDCLTEDYLHSIGTYACLTTISDCAGYTSCTGESIASSTQCPTGSMPSCDTVNNAAMQCNAGGGGAVKNCTKIGGTCGTYTDDAGVVTADCVAVGTCTQTDGNQYCSGSSLYTCIGGKGYGENCTLIDATCLDGGSGPGCYFNGPACATPGYTCSANVANWCTSGNVTLNFNCSTAGLTCTPNADGLGTAQCLAPGCTSTDIANCTESCSGNMAQVCIGGAPFSFDCSKIASFTTCATFMDSNLVTRAYCQ